MRFVWCFVASMNCVTYCRVSTDEQTIEPQRIELAEYARRRCWTIAREFSDVISGGKTTRAGLDALLALVRDGGADAVLVVKLDRMARSLSHFAQIVALLDKSGVAFIATSQGIDTSKDNPAGRLQMHVLAAVAEFERSLIRERTRAGMAAARARGSKIGHPSVKMAGVDRAGVVARWRAEHGGNDYRTLARLLGGVSSATAWRVAAAHP